MGTSDGGEGGSVVDCSVGTIVWVRRRNGSWWPGRILGPEELAASHLMSPRSGTPVKLLGREDASVDWYNLEKSKRVKAFRCGEFDACIERAEASQGIPIKKREKYARREDAILHALELERQQFEIKHQKLGTASNGTSHETPGVYRRELHSFSSDIYTRDDEAGVHTKYPNHNSHIFPRKVVLLGEEENKGNSSYVNKGKASKSSGWEEYSSESIPRMRGLQDFGLRIAPPKKKVSQAVAWEASQETVDIHMNPLSLSERGLMMGDASNTGGSKSPFSSKRKRPQSGSGEDSLVKKRDRRRPLHQVLQSSAKLASTHSFLPEHDYTGISMQGEGDNMGAICRAKRSRCVYLPADSNDSLDDNVYPSEEMPDTEAQVGTDNCLDYSRPLAAEYSSSGLAEETESDSSETDYLESDPDDEGNLTDSTQALVPVPEESEQQAVQVSENFEDLNNDEMPLVGYIPLLSLQDQMIDVSADAGVSKWHMKGKRNIRNIAKKPVDVISSNVDIGNGPIKGTVYESMGSSFKMRRTTQSAQRSAGQGFYHKKESSHFAPDGVDMIEKDVGHGHLIGHGNRRYPFALREPKDHGRGYTSFHDSDNDSHLLLPTSWGADGMSSCIGRRSYWEESDDRLDPAYADHLGDEMESMLVDVDIQVQKRSYQGEHVPWVSLSSKGNGGKPILGHPVQIEILEDGSTDHFVSKYDVGREDSSVPPSFRRTAKRSVMHRIPRPNPAASVFDEDADLFDSDEEIKPPLKKAYTGYFNHQARLAKKSNSHARRPSMPGRFQKKLIKKVSIPNQKTRTLSSFATEKRLGGESGGLKISRRNNILDGLIKPEGGIPLVTCVPVKVVFSRILEAVGRPSLVAAHRVRLASPAVRGLS